MSAWNSVEHSSHFKSKFFQMVSRNTASTSFVSIAAISSNFWRSLISKPEIESTHTHCNVTHIVYFQLKLPSSWTFECCFSFCSDGSLLKQLKKKMMFRESSFSFRKTWLLLEITNGTFETVPKSYVNGNSVSTCKWFYAMRTFENSTVSAIFARWLIWIANFPGAATFALRLRSHILSLIILSRRIIVAVIIIFCGFICIVHFKFISIDG